MSAGSDAVAGRRILGVDVGGTKTAVCSATPDGQMVSRVEFGTGQPDAALERIVREARRLGQDFVGIGISCGGPLDWRRGIVQSPPNLPGWDDVPIVARLSEALSAPVWLENDANAGALAEWWFGAGRGLASLVFLTCGTGMGAGLILDGRLYRGATGMAGEVGHVRLAEAGPVGYHKAGSFEGFCSGGGIGRLAGLMKAEPHAPSPLDDVADQILTARDVGDAAAVGDAFARDVIVESGRYLGRALAVLVDVLNPELIVLGALSWRLGSRWLDPAVEMLRAEGLAQSVGACRVVPAALGKSIGDYAAIAVAMNGLDG